MLDRLDATASAAVKDQQTVTAAGEVVASSIDGVRTDRPVNHVDHRGRVFEVYAGESGYWSKPVVYCYTFTIRPLQLKGWGLHLEKDDRYTLICGEVLTLLYDARLDSPTHGMLQKVPLSGEGVRQLTIPAGVWHLSLNLTATETFLINHPTQVYRHEAPDRYLLPWHTNEIPIDVASLFPRQLQSWEAEPCT